MLVSRVRRIKDETVTFTKFEDLEEIVIDTMGEDTWNAIMYFHEIEIEKIEREVEKVNESNSDIDSISDELTLLREDADKCIKELEDLIESIKNSSRIQRLSIIDRIRKIKSDLALSEGML